MKRAIVHQTLVLVRCTPVRRVKGGADTFVGSIRTSQV